MRQRFGRFFGLGLAERCQFRVYDAGVFAGLGEKQVEFALPVPKQNHVESPLFEPGLSSEAPAYSQPAWFLGNRRRARVIPSLLRAIQALPLGARDPRLEAKE